jgi:hypothetical protein
MLNLDPAKPAGGINRPFCVKYFDDVVAEPDWGRLILTFPPQESLTSLYAVGTKHRLCDRDEGFAPYIKENPWWGEFFESIRQSFAQVCTESLHMTLSAAKKSAVRFEFSSLPGDGGGVYPHPDTAKKVATAVLYCEPDWDPAWGGGFEALRHKTDPDADWTDLRPDWSEVETVLNVPVVPKRIVFMRRSNNSLHGVRPINAPRPRRSVTINLIGKAQ